MSERLPTPGGDTGNWADVLNGFLGVVHNSDGTLLPATAGATVLSSGAAAAGYVATATGWGSVTYAAAAGGSDKLGLTPTAVKTSGYTAVAGDLVPVDTTSGSVTVTLPNAPATGSVVAIKHVIQGSTNTVSLACAGSDVFNKTGGPTGGTLTMVNQGAILQYNSTGAIWYSVATDTPLSGLDARYAATAAAAGGDLTGNYPNPTVAAAAITTAKLASAVTVDAIATAHATAADVVMNSHKLTGLSAGSSANDSVRFAQIPAGGGQGVVDYQRYTGSTTWTKPAGATMVQVICIGSGGGGAGGTTTGTGSGGGGGGGGAVSVATMRAADITSPVTVTVDAGGAFGAAGANGSNGATTSFGTYLLAGGGGGGIAGAAASNVAGGGGGSVVNTAATSTAGSPSSASPTGGAAATATSGTVGTSSEWGGASGGGSTSATAGKSGGGSIYGGPGGGAGGSSTTGQLSGGPGGANQRYTFGGGGAGGGSLTGGTAGSFIGPYCGTGGGGGGGTTGAGTGGAGAAGSFGAGGGGGGTSASGTAGAGGAGGGGLCIVISW